MCAHVEVGEVREEWHQCCAHEDGLSEQHVAVRHLAALGGNGMKCVRQLCMYVAEYFLLDNLHSKVCCYVHIRHRFWRQPKRRQRTAAIEQPFHLEDTPDV